MIRSSLPTIEPRRVAPESAGAVTRPGPDLYDEIQALTPKFSPELLSRAERERCVERGLLGLYRWYVDKSQTTRAWHPDRSIPWQRLRKDHSDAVHRIVEGFYAVEQYVPDYVHKLLQVIRRSYGRSHFHIRWGAEEEKHGDLWRNAVLSMGRRTPGWMEAYTDTLRGSEYALPWDDPLHMLFYTVFQERATQVNYLNLGLAAAGQPPSALLAGAEDPVLAQAARTIAIDEAAHYAFFLEAARLFVYYFPQDAIDAMTDVVRHFGMPAQDIIPEYEAFTRALHRSGVFSRRIYHTDVVGVALRHLGAANLRVVEDGLRRSRVVPDPNGNRVTTAIFDTIDHDRVEASVQRLFARIDTYAREAGVAHTLAGGFERARTAAATGPAPSGVRVAPLAEPSGAAPDLDLRIDAALTRCDELLTSSGASAGLEQLVADLQSARASAASNEEWRQAVTASRRHPVHRRLLEDPYIAAAYHKPRGYAGDAHTIDFVYKQRPIPAAVTALGLDLHAVSTGVPIAQAVRARCDHIARRINQCLAANARPTIVSVACGHMRELHAVASERLSDASIFAVDQDPESLAALPRLHPEAGITHLAINVRRLIAGGVAPPEADLIYAAGLYDYLEDRAADLLTRTLAGRLLPGGSLLILNLTPGNEEIGFMEAAMDWWMVYRDETAMAKLGQRARSGDPVLVSRTYTIADGRVACLELLRPAAA